MNEDKMNLEEAKSYLETVIKVNNSVIKEARKNGDINTIELTADLDNQSIAIETVLKALEEQDKEIVKYQLYLTEDVIPKKKIEDKIKEYKKFLPDLAKYKEVKDDSGNIVGYAGTQTTYELAIKILQELLEDK